MYFKRTQGSRSKVIGEYQSMKGNVFEGVFYRIDLWDFYDEIDFFLIL